MNAVSSIIKMLTKEEKGNFVLQLQRNNKRLDTKNIELFKLLDANPNIQGADELLYGKRAKGAYHALCKRLYDSLIDFVAIKSFEGEQSDEMEIFKLVLASRIFFEQKIYKVAFRTLKKAEQKAKEQEFYGVLNEIYYTKIQYAHLNPKVTLDNLIIGFKFNKQLYEQEENLNLFYASIQNKLVSGNINNVEAVVDSLNKFNISVEKGLTFRSLFKIVEINNKIGGLTRDFYSLLPVIEKINKEIELKESLSEKHLFYHIQILYYIANSYFRNKGFQISQNYLGYMEKQMLKQNSKYYQRFFPQYILLKVLNLNYTGNAFLAIKILEQFEYEKFKEQVVFVLDLKLALIVFYFQQSKYKDALSLYNELYCSDKWYENKVGVIWVIKKNLIEIMLYIELDKMDLVESRAKSFRKKHAVYLKSNNEFRVFEFLSLITHYYYNKNGIDKEVFMERVRETLVKTNPEYEDIFIMSFYAWLKARVLKLDVYKTTLNLILLQNGKS